MPTNIRTKAEELVATATKRDTRNAGNAEGYKGDAFSRTLGDEVIRRVGVRAPINAEVKANLLDPTTLKSVRDLGTFRFVNGIATISLTDDERANIVQTIWPAWFSSPTVSGGERRLWLFPNEWLGKPDGEKWCTKQLNGFFKEENKP